MKILLNNLERVNGLQSENIREAPSSWAEGNVLSSTAVVPDLTVGALLSASLTVVVASLSSSDMDLIVQRDFWLRILFNNFLKRIFEGGWWVFIAKETGRKKKIQLI